MEYPVSCNMDCGAGCALTAVVENGRLVKLTNSVHRRPHATACPVGLGYAKILHSPNRLRVPLMRVGDRGRGEFREISWDEALAWASEKMGDLKEMHGARALMRLGGSGSCRGALHNTATLTERFLGLWGGYTETAGNYSSEATDHAILRMLGTKKVGMDAATLKESGLILLWGANISDVRFGNELAYQISEAKKRGVPVVVIDPRKTRTARDLGTWWLSIYPGTDTTLMAAVAHVLISEGLVDEPFAEKYSTGYGAFRAYVLGEEDGIAKSPAWAASTCGVSESDIVKLARLYGNAKPAALIPGLSIQRTLGGEDAARMAVVLQTLTGNVGRRGGSSGAYMGGRLPKPACGEMGPVNGKGPGAEVPVYGYADAILKGDVRAVYNVGGNFLSQGSDIKKNIQAFESLDFAICHDAFLTPTATYCDLVLPVTLWPEREDILFPRENGLLYSRKAVEAPGKCRDDFHIFSELAARLGFQEAFTEGRSEAEWLDCFLLESDIKDVGQFKESGVFYGEEHDRVMLSDFISDAKENPLATESGLIEISCPAYEALGGSLIPKCQATGVLDRYPLRMVSPHPRYRIHSQTTGELGRDKAELWMNPEDALAREIHHGATVAVFNDRGRIEISVRITDEVRKGVVALFEGAWPKIDGGVDHGGSPNMLTDTTPTLPSGGSRTHSTHVQVVAF